MLRKSAGLPPLYDVDDLPDPMYDPGYVHVLTDKEQLDLHRQQEKFRESQTWYRPHGTETHRVSVTVSSLCNVLTCTIRLFQSGKLPIRSNYLYAHVVAARLFGYVYLLT